jgi:ESAT-6 family protein
MPQFQVTPEQVNLAGAACISTEAEIASTLVQLRTFCYSVESFYKGAGSAAFQELMVRWTTDANAINSALNDIGINLQNNAQIYATTEENVVRRTTALGVNL